MSPHGIMVGARDERGKRGSPLDFPHAFIERKRAEVEYEAVEPFGLTHMFR